MPPQSLLFSSDQETSHRLAQALQELAVQVDFCPEIFEAVKELTTRTFDVIVADWDDGVEAAFLLKTASELKSNCNAFTIVTAERNALSKAEQAGAHLLLTKPVLPGYAKYALLTSDEFVARMQTWQSGSKMDYHHVGESAGQSAPQPKVVRPLMEAVLRAGPPAMGRLSDPVSDAQPKFASLDSGLFASLRHAALLQWRRNRKTSSRAARRRRFTQFLWGVVIGVAIVSGGYVFSGPSSVDSPVFSAAVLPSGQEEPALSSDSSEQATFPPVVIAQAEAATQPRSAADPRLQIRVEPAYAFGAHTTPPPLRVAAREMNRQTVATPPSPQPAAIPVPESLRTPAVEASAHEGNSKPAGAGSLLATLEPVNLAEDLSEKLLLTKVQPSYPEKALRARLQGSVVLQAWIRKDGTIRDLKLIRGPWLLGQAACEAVKQWRYKPYLLNGKSVEAQTFVTVNFSLP
jgi:protein TonB